MCPSSGHHCLAISAARSLQRKVSRARSPSTQSSSAPTRNPKPLAQAACLYRPAYVPIQRRRRIRRRRLGSANLSADEGFAQNGQDRKLAFLNASVDRRTTSPDRLARPASPYVIQAGTVIPAALITGIRSDLPGQITAQVTENIFDSPTGRSLLVPQGARLIGVYDSQIAFGQSRVLLVWTRLIMPNGRSIVLERQPGADTAGNAGLQDEVDNHWAELFRAALLSTVLSAGTQLGSSATEDEILRALRRGGSDSLNQTGQQIVRRNLNIQPTLTIRPGFPVRVIVNRDLVLEPYRG